MFGRSINSEFVLFEGTRSSLSGNSFTSLLLYFNGVVSMFYAENTSQRANNKEL